jgi:hypothetical protein
MNSKKLKIIKRANIFFALIIGCQLIYSQNVSTVPYIITDEFIASGYMGDKVKFIKSSTNNPVSGETCIEISYTASNQLWGGLFWQKPANNWCQKPGVDLSKRGYAKLTFWARGSSGNEEIKFIVGHDCGDSVNKEKIFKLDNTWQQYMIDLSDSDLTNITGAFGFSIDSKAQSGPITFFLDDVQFE